MVLSCYLDFRWVLCSLTPWVQDICSWDRCSLLRLASSPLVLPAVQTSLMFCFLLSAFLLSSLCLPDFLHYCSPDLQQLQALSSQKPGPSHCVSSVYLYSAWILQSCLILVIQVVTGSKAQPGTRPPAPEKPRALSPQFSTDTLCGIVQWEHAQVMNTISSIRHWQDLPGNFRKRDISLDLSYLLPIAPTSKAPTVSSTEIRPRQTKRKEIKRKGTKAKRKARLWEDLASFYRPSYPIDF